MFGYIQHAKSITVADDPSATSEARPSDWNSTHGQTVLLSGNTLGASTVGNGASTGIVLEGGSNVTLSGDTNNAKVVIIAASQSIAPVTVGIQGNTLGLPSIAGNPITLQGGNNVTLSAVGSTIVISGPSIPAQSNQLITAQAVGNTAGQSSSAVIDARSLSIDGAGIVSVGFSNNSLVISAPTPPAQSVQAESLSLGGNTAGVSNIVGSPGIVLAGGPNVTVSGNGATITISAGGGSQSNQTIGGFASGNTTGQSSSSTIDARSLSVNGAGGVSVGYSAGSLVISGPQTAAQTNQTEGRYAVGNTTGQSSSSTFDARTMSISAAGILSAGFSGGQLVLSATSAAQSNQTVGVYGISNTTGQSSSSTADARSLSFAGAGAVSVGMSGGSVVISAAAGGQSVQTLGVFGSSQTVGQSSSTTVDARSITLVGQGLVSVGASAGSILISASSNQSNQTDGIYMVGNTTGASSSSTHDARTLSVQGAGNVSVGWTNGSMVISGQGAGAGATQTVGISNLGNTSGTTGVATGTGVQMILAGGANVTLSQSLGGSSVTITISAASQTNQTVGVFASSQTVGQSSSSTVDARSLSLVGQGLVSVGLSAGSVLISATSAAQSNQTEGRYAVGNTTGQSSSSTFDARTMSISGAGGISVGYSAGDLVISGPQTAAQTVQTLGVFASSQTVGQSSSSTVDARSLTLVGQGIVSVGMSGGSVLISATAAGGANATASLFALGNTTGQSSSTSADVRSLSFDGAGIVSVGYSGASGLIISATTAAQTNQTVGVYASSQTVGQSSSSTIDARSFTHVGQGIVSVGMSGGSLLISATTSQSNQTEGRFAVGNTTAQSSSTTVDARSGSFAGAGIVSVGFSAGSGLVISATTAAQTNQSVGLYASSQTVGQSSSSTVDARSISLVGAGAVSVGLSGGSFIISGGATAGAGSQSFGMSNLGNTSGTTGVATGSAIQGVIAGGNNITVSQSLNGASATLTISAPNITQLTQAGIISLSSAGNTITISASQSAQTMGLYASSQTTGQSSSSTVDARSLTVVGMGGLTAGMSGGSLILSGGAGGGATSGAIFNAGNTTGQSSSSSMALSSINFSGAGAVSVGWSGSSLIISGGASAGAGTQTVGISNLGNTSGTSGVATGSAVQLLLDGGNNITLSQSVAGNAATVTISGPNFSNLVGTSGVSLSSAGSTISIYNVASQTAGMSNIGNTAGTTGVISGSQIELFLAGGNNVTLSQSITGATATVTISGPNQSFITQGNMVTISTAGSSATIDAFANIVSASGNTTGTLTTFSSGTMVLAGGSGILLSQSSNTISILQSPNQISQLEPFEFGNNTSASSLGQSSLYLMHVDVPEAISLARMNRLGSLSLLLSQTGRTNSSGAWSNSYGYSETVGLYSRGTGTNSTAIFSMASSSWSMSVGNSLSVNSGGATTVSITQTLALGFVSQIDTAGGLTSGSTTFSGSTSSGSSSVTLANPASNLTGVILMPVPFGTKLSQGDYYVGVLGISSSTSAGSNVTAASLSMIVQTALTSNFKFLGQTATNTSARLMEGQGVYSAQTAALASKIGLSEINNNSNISVYYNLANVSY